MVVLMRDDDTWVSSVLAPDTGIEIRKLIRLSGKLSFNKVEENHLTMLKLGNVLVFFLRFYVPVCS